MVLVLGFSCFFPDNTFSSASDDLAEFLVAYFWPVLTRFILLTAHYFCPVLTRYIILPFLITALSSRIGDVVRIGKGNGFLVRFRVPVLRNFLTL